jgi:hypothetical protein
MSHSSSSSSGRAVWPVFTVWILAYFGIRAVLESTSFSPTVRVLLSLSPLLPFVAFLWTFLRALRTADELEQRVQLEALAVAFPLGVSLLTSLGLVQRAVALNPEDWSFNHIWPMFVVFYVIGLAIARRRYL